MLVTLGVLLQLAAAPPSFRLPELGRERGVPPGNALLRPEWIDWAAIRAGAEAGAQDTGRTRRRTGAIEYSNFYHTRLTLHRWLSFAMLPLFAGSYLTGEQLIDKGDDAPGWARHLHKPLAAGTAVVFTVNTITGVWNLWESRKDSEGRTKRYIHSLLFAAAGAGFVYAATKAGEDNDAHRTVALVSMGISVSSWALMLFFK